jgi:hypothetical protein
MHLSNSVSNEEAMVYCARSLHQGPSEPEGTEQLRIRWVSPSQAWQMVRDGVITDAISVAAIQHWLLLHPDSLSIPVQNSSHEK